MSFNHLIGARSHFSIGESTLQVKEIVRLAKELGYKSVALADTMTISGLVELTNACKEHELQPIIGTRLRLVDDPTYRKPTKASGEKAKNNHEVFLKLFARTEKGLKILMRLLSRANEDDRFYHTARLGWEDLLPALDGEHLLGTSGDVLGLLHHPCARDKLQALQGALGASQMYLELSPIPTPLWDTLNKRAMGLADELRMPCIVTLPAFYAGDGADSLDVLSAISHNNKLADPWALKPFTRDHNIKRLADIVTQVKAARGRLEERHPSLDQSGWKPALENLALFAGQITYIWEKMPISLPKLAEDEFAKLVEECKLGWRRRFSRPAFGHKPTEQELKEVYAPRLKYELGVLRDMGFAGYFLLVQDLVVWSKSNGIAVGPGRGSVGGSLVAYLVGITDVDPIRFNLLFERFINPERLDLPDADLDFMSTRRHEVIDYLVAKYGADRVAGISNYGTLGPALAIRDVGRVIGLHEDDYRCSKLVPKEHGISLDLEKARETVPEIAKFAAAQPTAWRHATALEGVMRSLGRHAAGIVVAAEPLVNRAVVERRKDGATICWDKRIVEDFGLVKMDILGLNTLDILEVAKEQIWKRHGKRIDFFDLTLDDPKVLANFAAGRTIGVFQFESAGMRRLLKDLGSSGSISFEDITAATALYRPGPMDAGLMEQFVQIKLGNQSERYDHPNLMPALKDTYGVIVYQEQVMQAAVDLAGFTKAGADKLRKAMGKKLPEEMKKQRQNWIDGCVRVSAMTEEEASALFDKIELFAGYAFNKSHSVEYTLISYIAMWLKTNYPPEFYAAALSVQSESSSQDRDNKLASLITDAGKLGIVVQAPDLNVSTGRFEILNDTTLCIPFSACKGISGNTTTAILEARQAGQFTDIADFLARVQKRKCNVKHQDILRRVGAFARIEPGSQPAGHVDRLKDQIELMPGLIIQAVKADRDIDVTKATLDELMRLITEYRELEGIHPKPFIGKRARFMVISDYPTWAEAQEDQITKGKTFSFISEALAKAKLSKSDGYWTALCKTEKSGKQLSAGEIATYLPFLQRELDLLKPAVIVCMGSAVARHFMPGMKGGIMDHIGKVMFDPALDASIVIAFNTGMIVHDPDKQALLDEVFIKVAEMVTD